MGVRWCYSDFFTATRINFLTEERTVCSAKLGPVMTEYFYDYRRRVEAAPEAALVAANHAYADKIEKRLQRLGVDWERRDLLRPVFLRLSRKVDPEELFPGRPFPFMPRAPVSTIIGVDPRLRIARTCAAESS